MEFQVSRSEGGGRVHLHGVRTEPRVFDGRAKPVRKIVGGDEKLTSKSKVDLARLPPCHSALKQHLQRMNYRVALYKRADESILKRPYDDGQGWIRTEDGLLEPGWFCGAALPNTLVTLLDTGDLDEEKEEEEENEDERV